MVASVRVATKTSCRVQVSIGRPLKDQSTISPSISLSISVVCYNSSEEELKVLVESTLNAIQILKASVSLSPIPVYLIDNSEEDNLSLKPFTRLQTQAEGVNVQLHLLHGHGNVGYGAAHNLVIEKLDSDYHLLLNPDLKLDQNCLEAGISYLTENENVVMASPFAAYENGEKQYLCKRYPSVFTFIVRGFFPRFLKNLSAKRLARFEMRELPESCPTTNIPIISGCYMLCRTKTLQGLGGFDEKFFLYFEDFDLSLRMATLGEIAYVPAMRITHAGGNAARKGWSHIKMFVRSGIRFFNNHGWWLFRQSS
ncbi:MAG: glycosyl transferase [SAR86 cluster bacterium]|uniref:Glycosyl transferase n=1 Tax=SAR86 cluster bacterium TaxID=2030880 RepID=A0A2A4X448_9GAMM|nr:MAG: glycosyl transferase [SAR86 cluster bacterium]